MASRSRGRQFAVQLIYQSDFSGRPFESVLESFWDHQNDATLNRDFAETLARGVIENRERLDLELTGYLENWTLERLISLNRIILELALFELEQDDQTPWKVVVDEAVMLTRVFCGEEHINFVNGILHRWCMKNRKDS
ncbi:MAG: transcription antitermination factor NusB [Acidobacteria bacterium]|nr:MAG: transcription antitermination factor NusB [Acidobacteriota bacterium]PIE90564.1 MAG: transcription antitermination factor NusB [Acidobacteriota bacterium]